MRRRALVVALAGGLAGCGLAARSHPCWPYVQHVWQGRVPATVVKQLASEHGAVRSIRGMRPPTGYYWRPAPKRSLDLHDAGVVADGHKLAACPGTAGAPRPAAHAAATGATPAAE